MVRDVQVPMNYSRHAGNVYRQDACPLGIEAPFAVRAALSVKHAGRNGTSTLLKVTKSAKYLNKQLQVFLSRGSKMPESFIHFVGSAFGQAVSGCDGRPSIHCHLSFTCKITSGSRPKRPFVVEGV